MHIELLWGLRSMDGAVMVIAPHSACIRMSYQYKYLEELERVTKILQKMKMTGCSEMFDNKAVVSLPLQTRIYVVLQIF